MKAIITGAIAIALMGNAIAEAYDATYFADGLMLKEWMDADAKKDGAYNGGIYGGYVTGVHDSLNGMLFCTPKNVSVGQMKAVVAKYMSENPVEWNRRADWLVVNALKNGFPCPKKNK
jgi:hypothetical protein